MLFHCNSNQTSIICCWPTKSLYTYIYVYIYIRISVCVCTIQFTYTVYAFETKLTKHFTAPLNEPKQQTLGVDMDWHGLTHGFNQLNICHSSMLQAPAPGECPGTTHVRWKSVESRDLASKDSKVGRFTKFHQGQRRKMGEVQHLKTGNPNGQS